MTTLRERIEDRIKLLDGYRLEAVQKRDATCDSYLWKSFESTAGDFHIQIEELKRVLKMMDEEEGDE